MKKLLITGAMLFVFGWGSAQTTPIPVKEQDKTKVAKPQTDSTSVNQQIQKESDLKTMDAVKTQDHAKPVPQKKKTAPDTTATVKRKGSGKTKP